jgi:hypothetical protein
MAATENILKALERSTARVTTAPAGNQRLVEGLWEKILATQLDEILHEHFGPQPLGRAAHPAPLRQHQRQRKSRVATSDPTSRHGVLAPSVPSGGRARRVAPGGKKRRQLAL